MSPSRPHRVVIAPDSFSGTLTAVQAAAAMAEGWLHARPMDDVVQVPMSDGGLGMVEVVHHAHPTADLRSVEVADARGIATTARWLLLEDGTAVVETAQAISLHALAPEHRDPLRTTSYGVGQLLIDVARTPGVTQILVGLGGSATVDGGVGMVSALTVHGVRRSDGNAVKVGGRWVAQVAELRGVRAAEGHLQTLRGIPIVAAADVRSPLLGPAGAAVVFGPQKGADASAVRELEACLGTWADVVESQMGDVWRDVPGAGAAGGLGFALTSLLGAALDEGAQLVGDAVRLDLADADVVVTGEGRLDAQTRQGKVPSAVAFRARAAGARVVVIAGQVDPPHDTEGSGFDEVHRLGELGLSDPWEAVRQTAAGVASRL